jgi:hypothetical protein
MFQIRLDGHESNPVGEYLVWNDAGVVVVEDVLYCHTWDVCDHSSAKGVDEGVIDAFYAKLYGVLIQAKHR